MSVADYKRALQAAHTELQQVVSQRDQLNLRIVQLQQTIKGLALRCAAEERVEIIRNAQRFSLTISEAIKTILRTNQRPLTAVEVRDALWATGFDLGGYSNPLALVNTTLERLVASDNVMKIPGRKPASYQWFVWEY